MILIIPLIERKNTQWRSHLINNKMIQVHYMNTTPIEGFENISFQLISRQLGMPRPHNVLIPTILHAINLDFKKIYSFFIKQGNLLHENKNLNEGAFIKIEKESKFNFKASSDLELFEIRSPLKLSYSTYYQRFN